MSRDEKPNSAEFAGAREEAMLKSRKNGNPLLRMVPAISSLPSLEISVPESETLTVTNPVEETPPSPILVKTEKVSRGGEISSNPGCLIGGALLIGCISLLLLQPRRV